MPAWAVADHPVKSGAQIEDHAGDAFLGQRVLVAGLRGRKQVERVEAFVADQRLGQLGDALDHIDEVEYHAPFGAHDEIEVAQSDIEIHDDDVVSQPRQRGAQRGS